MKSTIFFSNQCFSEQLTPVFTDTKELIGHLELSHILQSNISVLDLDGHPICSGEFKSFTNKWFISSPLEVIGELRQKLSFFKTEFEYLSYTDGLVEFVKSNELNEFQLLSQKEVIAEMKTNEQMFEYPTFELINYSNPLFSNEELLIVAMSHYYINFKNNIPKQKGNRKFQQL